MRSSTETLVTAMRVLARDIQSGDGVANAAIAEAADRLAELERENAALRDLTARMATEMREVDHEFASLQDYDAARKEAQP